MAAPILMPQVGISVESCIITEWLKQPGDQVNVGDLLFSYETDKSSLECESTEAGTLLEIFYENGDEVPVLKAVCAIGTPGEDVSSLRPSGAPAAAAPDVAPQQEATVVVAPVAPAEAATPVVTSVALGEIKISPRAKTLAKKQNADITQATPTGPKGRIIERDIRQMMETGIGIMTGAAFETGLGIASGTGIGGRVTLADLTPTPASDTGIVVTGPEFEDVKFSPIRKAISRSMSASLREIPQLTHNFSFDATEIMAYRAKIKASGEVLGLPNITINDFLLYAVSRYILKYPELNAHMLDGETIRYFKDVHLGLAVDTPRGLMVPVIKYANRKSLAEISAEVKELAAQTVGGNISPDKLSGATFTISNLGTVGVESFTPVINPPETGILGVCNINDRVRKEKDGGITAYPAMGLSLTYDHRAIDGAPASRFVHELCGLLENFSVMLAL